MYHLIKGLYLTLTSKEEYSILLLGLDNAGKTTLLEQIKLLYSSPPSQSSSSPLAALSSSSSSSSTPSTTSTTTNPPSKPIRTVPTVGQNTTTIDLGDMYLRIWDVGGQHALRGIWQGYYGVAHAIVFVVDSSDVGDGELQLEYVRSGGEGKGKGKGRRKSGGGAGGGTARGSGEGEGEGEDEGKEEEEEEEEEEWERMTPAATPSLEQGVDQGRLDECRLVLESILRHSDTEGLPILILANKQDREDCVEVVRIKEGFVRKVFEGEKGSSVRDSRVLPCSALTGTGVSEAVEWVKSRVRWNKEGRPPVMR